MDEPIFMDSMTIEGVLALYLARDFARAGMEPSRIADAACQVATHVFAQMRFRKMLTDQESPQ